MSLPKPRRHGNRWHPETCVDRAPVIDLYNQGLSTRQVAEQLTLSASYVHKICQHISRDRTTAAKLRQPRSASSHWRTCRQQARQIWAEANGPIPSGFVVHHIDNDFTNNQLENLACISTHEHGRIHHAGPLVDVPRHLRPLRKAYMKRYLKNYWTRKKLDVA